MIQIKKILLPTDFSDCSNSAADYARELCTAFGAEVLVVYVAEAAFNYKAYGLPPETIRAIQKEQRSKIDKQMADVQARLEGCVSSLHVREGRPFSEIVEVAKEHKVDLIVLGTHGRTGLKHLWLGSQAERVVRTAPCPVLTVRTES